MAFFSLIAHDPKKDRWRACAVFPAGSQQQAIVQAKALRDGNSLGFLPHPTRFRLRRASRREVSLLTNFLNSVDNSTFPTYQAEYLDGLLNRRRNLMNSFFLGLFMQPEVLKRKWGNNAPSRRPGAGTGGAGSGGVENETENALEEDLQEGLIESDAAEQDDTSSAEAETDGLVDASNQESVLDNLENMLTSEEATDKDTASGEIDLDFI